MTGERLGNVGQQPDTERATSPQWKLELLSLPSVSARRGVARGFDAAYEDTSTLVLTSPGHHFVDIRFALGDSPHWRRELLVLCGDERGHFSSRGEEGR